MAYTFAQLEGYWINAGGPPQVAPQAAAIALAESSGDNVIQKDQPYQTTGWGLWQITPGNSVPEIGVDNALLDPAINAKAAVAKYEAAGNSFRPWTTYTSGRYLTELQTGVSPDLTASSTPATLTGLHLPSIPGIPNVGSAINAGEKFGSLLGRLLDPQWWMRVGKFAIAILLGLVSASFLFTKTEPGRKVSQEVGMAAMAVPK